MWEKSFIITPLSVSYCMMYVVYCTWWMWGTRFRIYILFWVIHDYDWSEILTLLALDFFISFKKFQCVNYLLSRRKTWERQATFSDRKIGDTVLGESCQIRFAKQGLEIRGLIFYVGGLKTKGKGSRWLVENCMLTL